MQKRRSCGMDGCSNEGHAANVLKSVKGYCDRNFLLVPPAELLWNFDKCCSVFFIIVYSVFICIYRTYASVTVLIFLETATACVNKIQ